MTKLRCILVDDEPLAVRMLENFVKRTEYLELVGAYNDPVQGLSEICRLRPELVFLDIQMPGLDGMELSRSIPKETRVVFTTAFKEYAFDSYEVNALDFLLKPIRYQKFAAAVEKAREWFDVVSPVKQQVFLRVDGSLVRVLVDDILYVSGMKDYMLFYLEGADEPLISHITMKAVEDMLPPDRFMRVSRSYIVALDKIRSVSRSGDISIGNEIIHVTDSYRPAFNSFLSK